MKKNYSNMLANTVGDYIASSSVPQWLWKGLTSDVVVEGNKITFITTKGKFTVRVTKG